MIFLKHMKTDIRQRSHIEQRDVLALNFIRNPNRFAFRRHYRQGLRSHVMEVLDPAAIRQENTGIERAGSRWFPKATPLKILRIFRNCFDSLPQALAEIKRFQIIKSYITAEYLAVSEEFIADYTGSDDHRIILCGLQEFVPGHTLDPWSLSGEKILETLFTVVHAEIKDMTLADWVRRVQRHTDRFIRRLRRMILEARLIPDLAGAGNLMLTASGRIKLVDINNICCVSFDTPPPLDEKGYPTCDKSVEALARIETNLLGRRTRPTDPVYRHFLSPERMAAVTAMGKAFHKSLLCPPKESR